MHPTPANHYFYQDTWEDFYGIDILSGVNSSQKPYVLGGGACQWGEAAWGHSFQSHVWPRAIAVAEVLWSNPSSRVITDALQQRIENLGGTLYKGGIMTGPINAGAPYLGYQHK